jgi:hypothetical protein
VIEHSRARANLGALIRLKLTIDRSPLKAGLSVSNLQLSMGEGSLLD